MIEGSQNPLRNADLLRRLETVQSRVKNEYLRFWQVHAPHYTDHGNNHCNAVELTLKEILADVVFKDFNEYEYFILLTSIWLHDIGIMVKKDASESQEKIREHHNERSREMIRTQFTNLLLPQERIVIGNICWSHSIDADITKLVETKILRHPEIGNMEIRVQFLAALLRLCDALDLCCTRTSETVINISELSDESRFYHILHSRVSGLIRKKTQILIDINFSNEDEKDILNDYIISPSNYELESVRNILAKNNIIITDIIPRYNYVPNLEPLEKVPEKEDILELPEDYLEFQDLKTKYSTMIRNNKIEDAENVILDLIEKYPDNVLSWFYYGQYYEIIGDNEKALKGYKNASDIEPDNSSYVTLLGHFYGEILLNIDKSFEYFKRAYNLEPESELNILNFVEALITKEQYDEAIALSKTVLESTQLFIYLFYSKFLLICSKCIKSNSLDEVKEEVKFLGKLLIDTNITNFSWVYNKLRVYIDKKKLKKEVEDVLLIFINYVENEISKKEFLNDFYNIFIE